MKHSLMSTKTVCFLAAALLFSGNVFSSDLFAGQIQEIDLQAQKVQVSDAMYFVDEFTIVRRNANSEGVRMPLSSLREGMWVVVVQEYSDRFEGFMAKQLWLFPNERAAMEFQESSSED